MIAFKLFRRLKTGEITSLFINKKQRLPISQWIEAECHQTNGFALRPGWHCVATPNAPHLSERGRVWATVEIEDFEAIDRPEHQGTKWFLAKRMKIIGEINE